MVKREEVMLVVSKEVGEISRTVTALVDEQEVKGRAHRGVSPTRSRAKGAPPQLFADVELKMMSPGGDGWRQVLFNSI